MKVIIENLTIIFTLHRFLTRHNHKNVTLCTPMKIAVTFLSKTQRGLIQSSVTRMSGGTGSSYSLHPQRIYIVKPRELSEEELQTALGQRTESEQEGLLVGKDHTIVRAVVQNNCIVIQFQAFSTCDLRGLMRV